MSETTGRFDRSTPAASLSPGLLAPPARAFLVGVALVGFGALVYWLSGRHFEAMRGDLFYLADAFLDGRTWLGFAPGTGDVVVLDSRVYVPFGPFPAIALMPVVAVLGPETAHQFETGINTMLGAVSLGLAWMLVSRLHVEAIRNRIWLLLLFGFSTPLWSVTMRGGVWHTSQLFATVLTLACLVELEGRRRPLLVGLLASAALLTRAPLALAIPFYALMLVDLDAITRGTTLTGTLRRLPLRDLAVFGLAVGLGVAGFLWYNNVRFGSPWESGSGLATLNDWLTERRELGLFALAHVPMNLDLLFLRTFVVIERFPFLRPDGHGLSILLTSPGLLRALRAPWRASRQAVLLGGAAVLVLVPSLLYYGGGWVQYGYRYALDSIPFLLALAGLAVARSGRIGAVWKVLIVTGVLVNAFGVYWNYHMGDPWV